MQSQIANEEDYVLFGEKQASKKALEFCSRHRDKDAVIFPTRQGDQRDNSVIMYSLTWQWCHQVLGGGGTVGPMCRLKKVLLEK